MRSLIFKEYEVTDHPKVVSVKESSKPEVEDVEEVGKKRVAHPSAVKGVTKHVGPSQIPRKKLVTPQQKMYERWRQLREAAAKKAAERVAADAKTQVAPTSALQLPGNVRKEQAEPTSSISNSYSQLNGNGRLDRHAIARRSRGFVSVN